MCCLSQLQRCVQAVSSTERTPLNGIFSGECSVKQQGGDLDLAEMKDFLYEYVSSAVIEVWELIFVTSSTDERALKKSPVQNQIIKII